MDAIQNEFETSLESTARGEDQADAARELYLERRVCVLQFLHHDLSPQRLQQHQNRAELLKKCCFYLDVEPKHVVVTHPNGMVDHTDIFHLIDPSQFQRMKEVGKTQTEVQLSLLTALLEQLERGREELSSYVETYDTATFLSRWDLIAQRMLKLSEFMEKVVSLQTPGKLYVKHRLVLLPELERSGTIFPNISLSLCAKMPLIFDRKESVAFTNWAKLRWFTETEEPHHDLYELQVKLVTAEGAMEVGYGRVQTVSSNSCVVKPLQPNRAYIFTVGRAVKRTLVFQNWHDSIILETKPKAVKGAGRSTCALEG